MMGALWAVGSAMVFSMGQVLIRKAGSRIDLPVAIAVMLVAATVIVGVASLFLSDTAVLRMATRAGFLYFGSVGLIHFIGGWSFGNACIRLIGAARMSAITGITPLFAAVLAILALNENLNSSLGLGILAITVGAYYIATG